MFERGAVVEFKGRIGVVWGSTGETVHLMMQDTHRIKSVKASEIKAAAR